MNDDAEFDQCLTKKQLAARLSVSTRTVENLMAANDVPYVKPGKFVRFFWPDVIDALRRKYGVGYAPGTKMQAAARRKL